jgi:hypothetical protein
MKKEFRFLGIAVLILILVLMSVNLFYNNSNKYQMNQEGNIPTLSLFANSGDNPAPSGSHDYCKDYSSNDIEKCGDGCCVKDTEQCCPKQGEPGAKGAKPMCCPKTGATCDVPPAGMCNEKPINGCKISECTDPLYNKPCPGDLGYKICCKSQQVCGTQDYRCPATLWPPKPAWNIKVPVCLDSPPSGTCDPTTQFLCKQLEKGPLCCRTGFETCEVYRGVYSCVASKCKTDQGETLCPGKITGGDGKDIRMDICCMQGEHCLPTPNGIPRCVRF